MKRSPEELKQSLGGVISFPVTPFNQDLSLNLKGLASNLEEMLQHPFCAVVAAGGTGEFYSLTPQEHLQIVKTTVEVVNGRIPVIAGTGFSASLGAELAHQSEKAGADGILMLPPYYPSAHKQGLIEYYNSIGKSVSLGLLIYTRDWVSFTPDEAELTTSIPNLIAWKDGQADLRRLQLLRNRIGDRFYWIGGAGDDMVPGYYSLGIRSYTSSISNVAPNLAIDLHLKAAAGDRETLTKLIQKYVVPLYDLRSRRKGYEVSAIKEMMEILGTPAGPVRPPLTEMTQTDRRDLEQMVTSWAPILPQPTGK
ncbi:MAG TPA: 5-dehydro-4-deoxyglucarate dehydratase [Verrucomicrobiales bacterium]|nr:5-dehydro-4-deoxyglucarate dehydratase [Verrucomicrobiales bacterium]HIL72560.1 5-dehydro-4-deoxyglucarate dehydratase [Verrucomicrobiota bacterium]